MGSYGGSARSAGDGQGTDEAMVLFGGALGLIFLVVWIFCIVDVITTAPDQTRNLPKLAWLLIVILLVDIGSIAWLVAGRNWGQDPAAPRRLGGPGRPARPGRPGAGRPLSPDDDEEFLASLRRRAEEQRRRTREADTGPDDAPPPPA